jgi:hypothetical protein
MSAFSRYRLAKARRPLLTLHRALIEASIREHERAHGRVEGANRLELVRAHSDFAWLRPISTLIVRIDEALEDDSVSAVDALVSETERLLSPAERGDELGRRYVAMLQADPDTVLAHAELRRAVERSAMN